ncbi:MAG: 2-C-methyl-D-erythritol 2,4-cyclodiphosphate synthase [Candidatus Omnitrophota bacterium]
MRVGIGYDIHALVAGRSLILAQVKVPFGKGLKGHSDADVVYHAICDAIFTASGSGDIGDHFPDTDPRYKNAPSVLFAEEAVRCAKSSRLKIEFIDVIVIAQSPKLIEFKRQMKENIVRDFGVRGSQVGLKAKTNEALDAVGNKKAIACFAAVTLR